jgi:hypothetical protein
MEVRRFARLRRASLEVRLRQTAGSAGATGPLRASGRLSCFGVPQLADAQVPKGVPTPVGPGDGGRDIRFLVEPARHPSFETRLRLSQRRERVSQKLCELEGLLSVESFDDISENIVGGTLDLRDEPQVVTCGGSANHSRHFVPEFNSELIRDELFRTICHAPHKASHVPRQLGDFRPAIETALQFLLFAKPLGTAEVAYLHRSVRTSSEARRSRA